MQKFIALAGFLCLASGLYACDICGNPSALGYMGVLPKFQKSFIGIRYQYRTLDTEHPASLFATPVKSHSTFHSSEVWGRYVASRRFSFYASVPYNFYSIDENDRNTKIRGIGDISVLVAFTVISSSDTLSSKWKHNLQVAAGVKLPTGSSAHVDLTGSSILAGSGSYDLPLNLAYIARYKSIGAVSELSARFNGVNPEKYQAGKRFASTLKFFYWKRFRRISLVPAAGFSYEYSARDSKNGYIREYSGASSFLYTAGLDLYYHDFALGFNLQNPVCQNLNGGISQGSSRLNFSLLYLFN